MNKRIFVALINSVCMSIMMSLVMTSVNVGFVGYFAFAWLKSCSIAFIIAFPLSYILPSIISRFVDKCLRDL